MDARPPYPAVVETDSYDRAAFTRVVATSPVLTELIASGTRLFGAFGALALDVFAALFKYNVILSPIRPADEGRAALARRTVGWVRSARQFELLRAETVLDEERAAYGTHRVLNEVVALLSRNGPGASRELEQEAEIDHLERVIDELENQSQSAQDMLASGDASDEQAATLRSVIDAMDLEIRAKREALDRLRRQQTRRLDGLPATTESQIRRQIDGLVDQMDRAQSALTEFGQGLGTSMGASGGTATLLDLGDKLASSERLRLLAKMVGAFREFARGVRRQRFERRPSEVHAVQQGADLSRLLPAEVGLLRHPQLSREFKRRYVEGQLLEYSLHGEDRAGRGPMVICIDGSGSMGGDRELWAKAVCLALADIARTQRRRCRALVFSGSNTDLAVFDLIVPPPRGSRLPPALDLHTVTRFADTSPRGGTDFVKPLTAAMDLVDDIELSGGDIVLITDGQAHVPESWLRSFQDRRRVLEVTLYGVAVDLGEGSVNLATLGRICDRVTSVQRLTAAAAADLFMEI